LEKNNKGITHSSFGWYGNMEKEQAKELFALELIEDFQNNNQGCFFNCVQCGTPIRKGLLCDACEADYFRMESEE
jgi:hypothetical protein